MRVRLVGIEPKRSPCTPRDGWYDFRIDPGSTVAAILSRFGLKARSLSVLRNGSLSDIDDAVDDQDELLIMLKSLGG